MSPVETNVPHNICAEQNLLGAMLNNGNVFDAVESIVRADDFCEPIHQFIFAQFASAKAEGRRTSYQLVHTLLSAEIKTALIGCVTVSQYMARLAASAVTIVDAPDFARVVVECAQRRSIIASAQATITAAACSVAAPRALATDLIEELDRVASRNCDQHVMAVSVGRAAERSFARMQSAMQADGKMTGVTTGIASLDEWMNGWQRGELVILAGRPGMGKSGVIISSVRQSAAAGKNVLLFSLEMSAEDIADRMLADASYRSKGAATYFDIGRGRLTNEEAEVIYNARAALNQLSIKIDPQGGLTSSQIATRARRYKQALERQGRTLDLVVIDHLHIMKPSARYSGNRVAEVTEISGALKALAKELNVPVVALAQLSRQVESRDNKRPTLADLRDSGSLEQDADAILFVFREDYYRDTALLENRPTTLPDAPNVLELIIAKHRVGPTGKFNLFFDVKRNALRSEPPIGIGGGVQ